MKAAIYTRVSREEQVEGYSLDAQADACRAMAQQREWEVVRLYCDPGRSGKSALRPEFQTMIQDAEAGNFDVIICHKLDRFSRSLVDVLTYLNRLQAKNVTFVSCVENFDFSTPWGKLILAVLGALAEWYLNNLSQEVRKGKAARVRAGDWSGVLSVGYTTPRRMRDMLLSFGEQFRAGKLTQEEYSRKSELLEQAMERYEERHDSAAVPCPFMAPVIRMIYDWLATGEYSAMQIAQMLNERGYRSSRGELFRGSSISHLIRNRFYIGEIRHHGKWLPGNHEPLLSKELFEHCQKVYARFSCSHGNTSVSRGVASYPLTSMLFCLECGTPWCGWFTGGKRYYRDQARDKKIACLSKPLSARAHVLEADVEHIMWSFHESLPAQWKNKALDMLLQETSRLNTEQQQQRRVQTQAKSQLERVKKLYVMGHIAEEEYLRLSNELNEQLEPESSPIPVRPAANTVELERAAKLFDDLPTLWRKASSQQRRAIFAALFKKLYVQEGHITVVEPSGIMWYLLKNNDTISLEGPPDTSSPIVFG